MEILIIILIVAMISQEVIAIWLTLRDQYGKQQAAAAQESIKNMHADFCNEKARMEKMMDAKDDAVRKWAEKCNQQGEQMVKMNAEIIERGKRIEKLEGEVQKKLAQKSWKIMKVEDFKRFDRDGYSDAIVLGVILDESGRINDLRLGDLREDDRTFIDVEGSQIVATHVIILKREDVVINADKIILRKTLKWADLIKKK